MTVKQLIGSIVILMIFSGAAFADPGQGYLEETAFSSGKIYVVVAVVVVLLLAIFGYLIALERRLKRLEKNEEKV